MLKYCDLMRYFSECCVFLDSFMCVAGVKKSHFVDERALTVIKYRQTWVRLHSDHARYNALPPLFQSSLRSLLRGKKSHHLIARDSRIDKALLVLVAIQHRRPTRHVYDNILASPMS